MNLKVNPIPSLQGSIYLPASKSYSIRAHFISACGGNSSILGFSNCDDAMVAKTIAKDLSLKKKVYNVGESGTSLRFLLPLLSLHVPSAKVNGKGTLIGRPNHHLCEALRANGMDIVGDGPKESVPIVYRGGQIKTGVISIDGSVSSQFISALLITLPRLKEKTRIVITGKKLVSSDYIVMTRQILAAAGIKVTQKSPREIIIKGNQQFKGLKKFHVPSDYGLAAFPMAAAALLPSKVILKGAFNDRYIQSDGHILNFLKKMGVKFTRSSSAITMRGPFQLKGGVFSLKDCPDLVPIMSVLGMFAKGKTTLTNIAHARVKESDRISDLAKELKKVGACVVEKPDSLTIIPQEKYVTDQMLDPHHDHRLAMAFAVLGLRVGLTIQNIECTHKSYPDFTKDMKTLGMA